MNPGRLTLSTDSQEERYPDATADERRSPPERKKNSVTDYKGLISTNYSKLLVEGKVICRRNATRKSGTNREQARLEEDHEHTANGHVS